MNRRNRQQVWAIPQAKWGVIGMCSFTTLTASTLTQNWVAGCVLKVAASGASFAANVILMPIQGYYTWAAMCSGDATVPTFAAWNQITPPNPTAIIIIPTGSTGGSRASSLTLVTIFGPQGTTT